jgi:RNA polymerase sigma factor FliA
MEPKLHFRIVIGGGKVKFFHGEADAAEGTRPDYDDVLVAEHLALVKVIAAGMRRRLPSFVDFEDLAQAGTLGLIDAARKFRPEKHVAFSTYAKHRIRGAILDSLRQCDTASREMRRWQKRVDTVIGELSARLHRAPEEAEIAQELEIGVVRLRSIRVQARSLEQVSSSSRPNDELPEPEIPTQPATYPDSICAQRELSGVLAQAVKELSPRHQSVLRLYYSGGMTMREIGNRLGVKESRICQVHKVAISRLGDSLRAINVTSSAAF